ncbi:ATP synthase F1 sector subunit alpha [Dirofilaria immitis]|nr:ATP synthase F1 sector subunit alpha [Dirofilaria immitis]
MEKVEAFDNPIKRESIGEMISVVDDIALVYGLKEAKFGEKNFIMISSTMLPQINAAALYLKQSRPFFRIGLCVVSFGGILSLSQVIFEFFALTGNDLVRFELWRLFTHFIIETNIFIFILLIWNLHQVASLIEPNWGIFETIKYLGIVQIGSSFLIAVIALLTFVITVNDTFFFRTYIFGLPAASSAVCVAMKQFLPDSILLTTPIGRVKNTHLPFCIIVAASLLIGFNLLRWVSLLQILFGVQISWIYLRFLQPHDDGEPKGILANILLGQLPYPMQGHSLKADLFPSKLQPLMRVLSSTVYTCLIQVRLCKPLARHIDLMKLDSVNVVLPSLQTKDTERRRQKALRDLTERLNRVQQAETRSWPEMEDIEPSVIIQDTSAVQQQHESKSQDSVFLTEEINGDKVKEKADV